MMRLWPICWKVPEFRAWLCSDGHVDPEHAAAGKIVSACGWWADENNHVLVYDTALDFWDQFPYLNDDRRDEAGEFVPAAAGQVTENGLPGMWVWGGRKDLDTNVLTTSEYYDVISGTQACNILLVDDDWDFETPSAAVDLTTSTLEYPGLPYDLWDTAQGTRPQRTDTLTRCSGSPAMPDRHRSRLPRIQANRLSEQWGNLFLSDQINCAFNWPSMATALGD
jgi:hypothetical protein